MTNTSKQLFVLCLGPVLASVFIFLPQLKIYAPQYIALISVASLIYSLKNKTISLIWLSYLISAIVFVTNGLDSRLFFLLHFYIFLLASQTSPTTTLTFALVTTICLINSLDSLDSVISLLSIPLISPLAHYVGKLYQHNLSQQIQIGITADQIGHHEKKFFLWFSLTLKNKLHTIIDLVSQLQSDPKLTYQQNLSLKTIKHSTKTILKTAQSLAKDIDAKTDE